MTTTATKPFALAIADRVRFRQGIRPNHATQISSRDEYIIVAQSWIEPGEYVGDGTDARYPDWTCVPLVRVLDADVAFDYEREHNGQLDEIRAFIRYYGEETLLVFADVADLEIVGDTKRDKGNLAEVSEAANSADRIKKAIAQAEPIVGTHALPQYLKNVGFSAAQIGEALCDRAAPLCKNCPHPVVTPEGQNTATYGNHNEHGCNRCHCSLPFGVPRIFGSA
jgi:hypothetical protein